MDRKLIKRGLEIQQHHGPKGAEKLQKGPTGTPEGDMGLNEKKKQRKESAVNAQRCGLHGVVSKGHW